MQIKELQFYVFRFFYAFYAAFCISFKNEIRSCLVILKYDSRKLLSSMKVKSCLSLSDVCRCHETNCNSTRTFLKCMTKKSTNRLCQHGTSQCCCIIFDVDFKFVQLLKFIVHQKSTDISLTFTI